jgi:uncharacterized membrane protein
MLSVTTKSKQEHEFVCWSKTIKLRDAKKDIVMSSHSSWRRVLSVLFAVGLVRSCYSSTLLATCS